VGGGVCVCVCVCFCVCVCLWVCLCVGVCVCVCGVGGGGDVFVCKVCELCIWEAYVGVLCMYETTGTEYADKITGCAEWECGGEVGEVGEGERWERRGEGGSD